MNKGDVVQLKSGGPKMTVRRVKCTNSAVELVTCVFFDVAGDLDTGEFPPECLKLAAKPKPKRAKKTKKASDFNDPL